MRLFALAVSASLLIGSCTDDPEPIEPTPSASAEPTPSPPELPESARKDTPAGAANFVRHWIDVSNYAAVTGDTSELKDLSDPRCRGCESYIDLYESTYAKGGYFKGGDRGIGEVDLEVGKEEVYIRGKVKAAPGRYRVSKSRPERESKAEETEVVFAVIFAKDEWRMTQVGLASKG